MEDKVKAFQDYTRKPAKKNLNYTSQAEFVQKKEQQPRYDGEVERREKTLKAMRYIKKHQYLYQSEENPNKNPTAEKPHNSVKASKNNVLQVQNSQQQIPNCTTADQLFDSYCVKPNDLKNLSAQTMKKGHADNFLHHHKSKQTEF